MILNKLKRTIVASAFGLVALLGTNEVANAQTNRQVQRQQQRVVRQETKVDRQRQKLEQERIQLAQQRQREEQIRLQNMRNRNGNVYSNNNNRVIAFIATAVTTRQTIAEQNCLDRL
jgi:Flp pilus assembly protein TadB